MSSYYLLRLATGLLAMVFAYVAVTKFDASIPLERRISIAFAIVMAIKLAVL